MSPTQIIGTASSPSTLGRNGNGVGSELDRSDRRMRGSLRAGTRRVPGVLAHQDPEVERTPGSRAARSDSTVAVLSAPQFACLLERERSLADRGTRRFSLLALRQRAGERDGRRGRAALTEFAQRACERLRSTDLVGRLDAGRVEILLTDTEPLGAQVVAAWVEQVQAQLGLDLDHEIYVYPTVVEPSTYEEQQRGPRAGVPWHGPGSGRSRGRAERTTNTHAVPVGENGAATNGKATNGKATNGTATNGKATNGHPKDYGDDYGADYGDDYGDDHGNGDGNGNGHVNGHVNGHAPRTAHESSASTELVAPDVRWPMEDLWPLLGVRTPMWKRSLDILLSGLALLALSPLFALIAIAIRLGSPGPVIFRQWRAGRGGRPFVFYKFRSMVADAEERQAGLVAQNEQDGPIFKIRDDPRITREGRLLRRWSIDELPQLWNVLKGDISLVGPRSPTLSEVREYERWQRRRLCVTGGITCTWQVSGRSQIRFREWMRMDMRYVASRNFWHDLRLLVQTLPAVISGRGAS